MRKISSKLGSSMMEVACILAILLATGCSGGDQPPSGIIQRPEMEKILWDLIQADQYSASYITKDSSKVSLKMENLRLYEEVFRLHQVSRDEFKKSYAWYMDHPELVRNIFDTLLARGNRLRTESFTGPTTGPLKQAPPPPPAVVNPISRPGIPPSRPRIIPSRPGNLPPSPGNLPPRRFPLKGKDSLPSNHRPVIHQDSLSASHKKVPLQ